jgi:uncharacterized protein
MDSEFMRAFQEGLAGQGLFASTFNFPYMEAGRKLPDPRARLEACFRSVADAVVERWRAPHPGRLVLGGKSMGGRIASHLVSGGYPAGGLLFLGYPLHPPGKPTQLRDTHLYSIQAPMLFVSGTRDSFATPSLLAEVAGKVGAHATIAWVDGGDHSLKVRGRQTGEVRREVLATIQEWLVRLTDNGPPA